MSGCWRKCIDVVSRPGLSSAQLWIQLRAQLRVKAAERAPDRLRVPPCESQASALLVESGIVPRAFECATRVCMKLAPSAFLQDQCAGSTGDLPLFAQPPSHAEVRSACSYGHSSVRSKCHAPSCSASSTLDFAPSLPAGHAEERNAKRAEKRALDSPVTRVTRADDKSSMAAGNRNHES